MGFLLKPLRPMADSDRTVRIALPVYVDIAAVTGGGNDEIVPADSYTPEDEQQRRGGLAQNARDIGNTLLSATRAAARSPALVWSCGASSPPGRKAFSSTARVWMP